MKLIDYTKILRSKNAGPLFITFDLMFDDDYKFEHVKKNLRAEAVARAYDVKEKDVVIVAFDIVRSIKITFPRTYISGDFLDTDIYGCQMHVPLGDIEI